MISPELSLVIPTFNERGSIGPLLSALDAALSDTTWEALFVDDSNDGTDLVIEAYAAADARVSVIHRPVNQGGLAGAVVEGLAAAHGSYLCVLDADLQHPPERAPDLLAAAR